MLFIFILYTVLFVVLIATTYRKTLKKYHTLAKTAASLGFLLAGLTAAIISGNWNFYLRMLPGFLFCFAGDVLLAVDSPRHKDQFFLAGLLAFLTGHLAFLWCYHLYAPIRWYDFIFPVVITIVAFLQTRMKGMHMQGANIPVLAYAFFVSMMCSKAFILDFSMGFAPRYQLIAVGSLLFLISDALLLFIIFYYKKFKWSKLINLLCYYYGMYLLSISLLY